MKKPFDDMQDLAIEFVEFDEQDQPKASSFTPLGYYCMKRSIVQKSASLRQN